MDKRIKIGALLVGAVLLVSGIVTHGWYTAERSRGKSSQSMGLGLWGTVSIERCRAGTCRSRTVDISDKAKGSTSTGLIMGKLGFIAGLLAAGGLLLLAVFAATKNPNEATATKVVMGLTSLALTCGVMFLTLVDADRSSVGYSAFLFFPGAIAGLIGGQLKTAPSSPLAQPATGHQASYPAA